MPANSIEASLAEEATLKSQHESEIARLRAVRNAEIARRAPLNEVLQARLTLTAELENAKILLTRYSAFEELVTAFVDQAIATAVQQPNVAMGDILWTASNAAILGGKLEARQLELVDRLNVFVVTRSAQLASLDQKAKSLAAELQLEELLPADLRG